MWPTRSGQGRGYGGVMDGDMAESPLTAGGGGRDHCGWGAGGAGMDSGKNDK